MADESLMVLRSVDIERIKKALDSSGFLSSDIAEVLKVENPLLRELFIDLYEDAIDIEKKIKRYSSLVGIEG